MRQLLTVLVLACATLPFAAVAQQSPVGRWQTIDDATGNVKSIVVITESAGALSGRVERVLQSDRGPSPTCDDCSGANRGKPVEGMTILWNLKPGGDGWQGGTILDPANGKTYKSKAKLLENGRKLGVSGCVAFICREQVWVRAAG